MKNQEIVFSKNQLQRYPIYLKLFRQLYEKGQISVSSPQIAKELGYSQEQIRKDLQAISGTPGRPKRGRSLERLIDDLEVFLGYRTETKAVLIGTGHLGGALLNYPNFESMGLHIVAAFDNDPAKIGERLGGKSILPMEELKGTMEKEGALVAILSVPGHVAQEVAESAIEAGAKGLWNFAPVHIAVPEGITVENVNLASSLAVLNHRMLSALSKEEQ